MAYAAGQATRIDSERIVILGSEILNEAGGAEYYLTIHAVEFTVAVAVTGPRERRFFILNFNCNCNFIGYYDWKLQRL
jgi:hypothetical protein